jgi:hypothetical protein
LQLYFFGVVIFCCIAWMTRPGRRPNLFVLDILPWLCVAASAVSEGALRAVLAWTTIALVYFSMKYNRLEASATPAQAATALRVDTQES